MLDFETGALWCGENKLFYSLDIKREPNDIVFHVTIYSRDEKGEIEDFVTGKGKNKDEAMTDAKVKWGAEKPITSCNLLHLCLDLIDQLCPNGLSTVKPGQVHPAPFASSFLVSTLRQHIANHLRE